MKTIDRTTQVSGAAALSFTGLNIAALNPKNGVKYSPNLYAFLTSRRQSGLAPRARVYLDRDDVMWLGFFDDTDSFIGARLSLVLCYGAKQEATCPVNLGPLREVEDFWAQYLEDGRCAIDRAHKSCFINDDSRWRVEGQTRQCLWCHKASQRLVRREETVVRENWATL